MDVSEFSPDASGMANARALQRAVDQGGTIHITRPGVYRIAATIHVGSHTALIFGPGVILQKTAEAGPFTYVFLNKGALTKTHDENILIEGLHLQVNEQDVPRWDIPGLRGQVAFFCVRDLIIRRFRCYDLGPQQFCIHVCTFEDLVVEDVIIHGKKDGVHLGSGRRFRISHGVFKTFDDAIALNAHDYDTANPELGWIEDGIVENCHDLTAEHTTGFFCRLLAGGWTDWRPGMQVQKSDTVISQGRLYRVCAQPDGRIYTSSTAPTHPQGTVERDGISWVMLQETVCYHVGVRNVVFRDITLHKPRIGFAYLFDDDRFSRSVYPGVQPPSQDNIRFENITVTHAEPVPLLHITTPADVIRVDRARLRHNPIVFTNRTPDFDLGPTHLSLTNCTFTAAGGFALVKVEVTPKRLALRTAGSVVIDPTFRAIIEDDTGTIAVDSDLPGLGPR
ncbi:MAG: hypothetical protein R3F03_11565 [Opitutaceae bacterium]